MRKIFDKVRSAVCDAAAAFAGLCGVSAAKYHQYLDRENEKVRIKVSNSNLSVVEQELRATYEIIVDLLIEAINNTHEVTHLYPITKRSQVMYSPWADLTKRKVWVFQLRCRYRKGHGVSAADVRRVLQAELNQLCDYYGFAPLIVNVWFRADGAVLIRAVFARDWSAARITEAKEVI